MSNTVINTNVTALNSHRALKNVGNRQSRSSERLSTGQRINRASDDAAGLSISEKMRSQIRGLDQATRNSQDGISLIQTAEGAMQEIQDITQRIRELAVQAANDTLVEEDRTSIASEVNNLANELGDIIQRTAFNGTQLLTGGDALNIQNGAMSGQNLEIATPDFVTMGAGEDNALSSLINALGGGTGTATADDLAAGAGAFGSHGNISGSALGGAIIAGASNTIHAIDRALTNISTQRSNLGALQNRLEHTISNLQIASENTSAAESRIRDTDMAREMMQLTQANVLQQAATSMLAQANQSPQGVLQLLN